MKKGLKTVKISLLNGWMGNYSSRFPDKITDFSGSRWIKQTLNCEKSLEDKQKWQIALALNIT